MHKELEPRYNHLEVEEKIYKLWEDSGYFNPDCLPKQSVLSLSKDYDNLPQINADKRRSEIRVNPLRQLADHQRESAFCIIMPPPNANGSLHIGHAVFITIEDILTRFYRMRGKRALWLPGADHAGFETQVVFDKKLEREGRNRFHINRDELWQEIWNFTQEHKKIMESQLRKLGSSCDWSREKFTLDPNIIEEVQKTFIKMHEDGLIYRGLRAINWCVKHQTALSDLEVNYIERKDPLYYMKYGPFTLATVRPETKFGDTAIAVNPKDKRYKKYIGEEITVQGLLGSFKIKVVADEVVDMEFGTGVVKVTPAHDQTDFEIATRHNLEIKQVIDKYGRLNEKTGPYQGLKVMEAREKVVNDLKERGLLVKTEEDYMHNVAVCYKCKNQLEPLPLPQWFVKIKPLAENAIKAVEQNKIKFYPDRYKKIYFHWMKNIRDWNISRQIIWGIRIPAWYCANSSHEERMTEELSVRQSSKRATADYNKTCDPIISIKKPTSCPNCKNKEIIQDPDVFDTWFSSGQWPYLTLGFKDNGKHDKDFKSFYPTDVMETAYDIFFFWVCRMIMMSLYRTGEIPFKHVYLHGLLRDKDRQKMSKSKGNVVDPLGISEIYGTDAVRMALIIGNTAGNDVIISEDKIKGYRNFATKLWNIARFILTQQKDFTCDESNIKLSSIDEKHLKNLNKIKEKVTQDIEKFRFHHAAEKLYHYTWHVFADKILEEAKIRLQSENIDDKKSAMRTLVLIQIEILKMLHPFMPFITEEIYQHFSNQEKINSQNKKNLLMVEKW